MARTILIRPRFIRDAALLLALAAAACAPRATAIDRRFAPIELQRDWTVAWDALREGHAGLYEHTDSSELAALFRAGEERLDRAMTVLEFYRVLAPAIAAIRDGHTWVSPPDEVMRSLGSRLPLLPLDIAVVGDRLRIERTRSSDADPFVGWEIREIDGRPAAEILSVLASATPADGHGRGGRRKGMESRFAENLITLLGMETPYDLLVREPATGRSERVRLHGDDVRHARGGAGATEPAAEFAWSSDGTGILTVRRFVRRLDAMTSMEEYLDAVFDTLRQRGTDALVLDLRGNAGGADELGRILLGHLVSGPFEYYRRLWLRDTTFAFERFVAAPDPVPEGAAVAERDGGFRLVRHPNLGLFGPSPAAFGGDLFVLMDSGSFSTTAELLSHLHSRRRGVFIGAESGGAYCGNTSGYIPVIALPHTGIEMAIPLVRYELAVACDEWRHRGIPPDHPVASTAAGDAALDLALDLARARGGRARHPNEPPVHR